MINLGFEESEGGLSQAVVVLPLLLQCQALTCWQCLDIGGEGEAGRRRRKKREKGDEEEPN